MFFGTQCSSPIVGCGLNAHLRGYLKLYCSQHRRLWPFSRPC